MGSKLELVGQRFGRLLVIARSDKIKNHYHWLCKCDCGKEKVIAGSSLRYGTTRSCGCLHKDAISTHGLLGTEVYNSWSGIIQRCTNPNCKDYKRYGAIGVTIADEWRHDLLAFAAYVGEKPPDDIKYTVGRIDNTLGYVPGNIRWETVDQQTRNRGLSCLNNTGHNGVTQYSTVSKHGKTYNYIVAVANKSKGKQVSKYFNIDKLGYDVALANGIAWRENILKIASATGYTFAPTHGVRKGSNG